MLAAEASAINGAGAEGVSAMFNSSSALLTGMIIAFVFSWKIALVSIACVPFMAIASMIDMKQQFGASETTDPLLVEANKMAGDSIINYKTVASFGNTEALIKSFAKIMDVPMKTKIASARVQGVTWGFS